MRNFFRNNPALIWMVGIITLVILAHLGSSAYLNTLSETKPKIDNWEYIWAPLFSITCWALAPVVLGAIIYFIVQHQRNVAITTDDVEDLAGLGLHIWLIIIILAMVLNFFSATAFIVILTVCQWCGTAILIGAIAALIIFVIGQVLITLFGTRGALVAAAVIIVFIALFSRGCSGLLSGCNKYKRDQIKSAQEGRTVITTEPAEAVTPIKATGEDVFTPNPNYRSAVINQGNNNLTNANNEQDIIIIDGASTTSGNNTDNAAYKVEKTADDNDE